MTHNPAEPRRAAVALKYDAATDSAPKVIAKGRGLVAEKIMARGQVSYPREQFFKFMFLPSKVEVKYQPKKRRNCPP
jgi:hypothetical protein